jgi:hypothetical protein
VEIASLLDIVAVAFQFFQDSVLAVTLGINADNKQKFDLF